MSEIKKEYISIEEYLRSHNEGRYSPKYAADRKKFLDYLEEEEFFQVEIIPGKELGPGFPDNLEYISREDIPLLDFKSIKFFEDFGLSEKEKVQRKLSDKNSEQFNVELIKEYIRSLDPTTHVKLYTSSFTAFVSIICDTEPVLKLDNQGVSEILSLAKDYFVRTMNYMVKFLNFTKSKYGANYGEIRIPASTGNPDKAYTEIEYILLAQMLFNENCEPGCTLAAKALENHVYAELWLYISIHFIAGMRAGDICRSWVYPMLKDKNNAFGIDPETLKEDILSDRISEETYVKVANYSIDKSFLEFNLTSKSGKKYLSYEIEEHFKTIFGKLCLIAEYHHYTSGEGYMKQSRLARYVMWPVLRDFFGEKYIDLFGRRNIRSRRLNKSFLQGYEEDVRRNSGNTSMALFLASYARNHSNLSSIFYYLRDRNFSRETADVALYYMMSIGVQEAYMYRSLTIAFPEVFPKLSLREKAEVIKIMDISALDLELAGLEAFSIQSVSDSFDNGRTEDAALILKTISELANNKGHSKQHGIRCMRTALGYTCDRPGSGCIDSACPYHLFTREGIPTLVNKVIYYERKYKETDNIKYRAVLKKKILPKYNKILASILRNMTKTEQATVKGLIEEMLKDEQIGKKN